MAQAQTAEMARDIKAIQQGVVDIKWHQQSDQIGAVENAVEQVEDLVERLRAHGKDGIEASEIPVIKNSLGDARHKCMVHLKDAVTKLENAKQQGSPRQAEKSLSKGAVEEVMLYLDLLGQLYAATVQFGLAQIALDYHRGMLDVVRTRTERITKSTAKFRAEIEEICGRLDQLDESILARLRDAWKPTPAPLATGATAYLAVKKVAGTMEIPVPLPGGRIIKIPAKGVAAVGGALLHFAGEGGVYALVQRRAEKKLGERLGQLTGASSRWSQTMDQAEPSLEALRTWTEELAKPGE